MPKKNPLSMSDHKELQPSKEESKTVTVKKDPQPLIDYVLSKVGKPSNLVKVEAIHYNWGEGRDNRWRVNIVTEEMLKTDLGNLIPTWVRNNCYFVHFDDESQTPTYCNPPMERVYE